MLEWVEWISLMLDHSFRRCQILIPVSSQIHLGYIYQVILGTPYLLKVRWWYRDDSPLPTHENCMTIEAIKFSGKRLRDTKRWCNFLRKVKLPYSRSLPSLTRLTTEILIWWDFSCVESRIDTNGLLVHTVEYVIMNNGGERSNVMHYHIYSLSQFILAEWETTFCLGQHAIHYSIYSLRHFRL